MTEFHEGFWVVAATSGPVIALAHALAIERSIRLAMTPSPRRFRLYEWARKPRGQRRTPPRLQLDPNLTDRAVWRRLVGRLLVASFVAMSPYAIALAGFALTINATLAGLFR